MFIHKFVLFTIIILFSISNYAYSNERKLDKNQFQTTVAGNQQKLSIRHKMIGIDRNYKVEFIVYHKNEGKKYYANIFVVKNNWGKVFFPKDFRTKDGSKVKSFPNGGKFIWNAIVEDEIVLNGSFITSISLFNSKVDLRKY